jgi:hypothetical protein
MQTPGSVHKLNYLQHREAKVEAGSALMACQLCSGRQKFADDKVHSSSTLGAFVTFLTDLAACRRRAVCIS